MRIPFRFAAAAACMLAPLPALANPTPEQAQTLQQQIRGWIDQTFGSGVKLPDGLFQVTAEGDHYRVTVHLSALPVLSDIQGGDLGVSVQMLPAGRWLFYDYHLASGLKFHLDLPMTGGAGGSGPGPIDFSFDYGKLNSDVILDPSFATPSVVQSSITGYDALVVSNKMRQHMHADAVGGHASLLPTRDGRIDVVDEGGADNFSIIAKAANTQQVPAVFLGRVDIAMQILGMDRDRLVATVQKLARLSMASTSPEQSTGAKPAPDRETLRDLYTTVRGIVTGGEWRESFEDLRTEMDGHMVALNRVSFGAGMSSPNGMLMAHMIFALDGITATDIPPQIRPYVPRHVLIRPNLSGIDLQDLDALIMAALASDEEPSMSRPDIAERVKAMFSHGGITAGLDALEVDLGATRFSATGKATALSPDHVTGQAEVAVTGFDALVTQVETSPEWGKAAPFLQLLGKLGRADGERIVWTITADNADVKVNGLDIPALIAAGKKMH